MVEARSTRLARVRLLAALDLPAAEEPAAASPEWTERKRARRSA